MKKCDSMMIEKNGTLYEYCQIPCPDNYYRIGVGDCVSACKFPYVETKYNTMKACEVVKKDPNIVADVGAKAAQAA